MLLSLPGPAGIRAGKLCPRAGQGLGLDCKVGLLTRMERVFIILAMLITGLVVPACGSWWWAPSDRDPACGASIAH